MTDRVGPHPFRTNPQGTQERMARVELLIFDADDELRGGVTMLDVKLANPISASYLAVHVELRADSMHLRTAERAVAQLDQWGAAYLRAAIRESDERDRARATAVRLEQELARVRELLRVAASDDPYDRIVAAAKLAGFVNDGRVT